MACNHACMSMWPARGRRRRASITLRRPAARIVRIDDAAAARRLVEAWIAQALFADAPTVFALLSALAGAASPTSPRERVDTHASMASRRSLHNAIVA